MPHGYSRVTDALRSQCVARSKRGQCSFRIQLGRTVSLLVQPKLILDSASEDPLPPSIQAYCFDKREVYVARYAVCTASMGILRNSVHFNEQLAAEHTDELTTL